MSRKRKSVTSANPVKVESPRLAPARRENSIGTRSQTKKARLDTSLRPEADTAEFAEPIDVVANSPSASSEDVQMINPPPAENDPPPVGAESATSVNRVTGRYTKHAIHWLLDGNTFVQVGEVRFKLHRTTLIKHSRSFRAMIENKSHERCISLDEETGSTVYCLDSLNIDVNDFIDLLNAMDNAISFIHEEQHPKTIAAILRAAHALEFDQFREFAVLELEKAWPSDVKRINHNQLKYAGDALLLAQQYNIKSILKCAVYELVRTAGFQQVTDSTMEGDDDGGDSSETIHSKLNYSLLVHVRERLVLFWMKKAVPPSDPSTCLSPLGSSAAQRCAISKGETYILYKTLIHDSSIFVAYTFNPICGLNVLSCAPWVRGKTWPSHYRKDLPVSENAHLCSLCAKKWRDTWTEERAKLWADLDTWLE